MNIKSKYFFVLVFFLVMSSLFAQETKNNHSKNNSLTCHSLQFSVYDFIRIGSFNGALISYKYHFNNDYALRIGLGLNTDFNDQDKNTQKENDLPEIEDLHTKKYEIESVIQFLKYWQRNNEFYFYVGVGPRLSYKHSEYNTRKDIFTEYNYSDYRNSESDNYKVGLMSSIGVEWFFYDFMSLHAEYSFHFSYSKSDGKVYSYSTMRQEIRNPTNEIYEGDGFEFKSSGAKLGLSIYF